MKTLFNRTAAALLSTMVLMATALAQVPPLEGALHHPNAGQNGIVVAEEKIAARIGAEILTQGGNAVDAAVATGFALAVTYPRAGNIGGGGFMLVHMKETGETIAIDYRETAPAAATRDMYLNEDGTVNEEKILFSPLSAGVPATVAGLLYVHEKYGKLSRKKVMAPAIKLARDGFELAYFNAAMFEAEREHLERDAAARAEFFKADGSAYAPGETMRRTDLANTLKAISKQGRDGFYKGPVADAIIATMEANGGLITHEDLQNYKVVEREPVVGTYRGYEIASMPPPSSGGAHLLQILNMLETRPPHASDGFKASALHFLLEAMRSAYADRAEHLGDPDFVDVSLEGLVSKEYAQDLAAKIDLKKSRQSSEVFAGDPAAYESPDTTHFSVIDGDGNMVANTYTLNLSFGSGIVAPGTGVLLNNEMDDFSAAPGVPNSYGLIGGEKNAVDSLKRPLSSMTPTLVFKDGEPFLATGGAGGSRIITSVLHIILNVIDRGMNIGDATAHPRVHHQWLPDQVLYETGISDDTKAKLEAMGHEFKPYDWYSRVQTAHYFDGWYYGYTDERMPGGGACAAGLTC